MLSANGNNWQLFIRKHSNASMMGNDLRAPSANFLHHGSQSQNCSDRILTCRIKSIRSPAKVGLVVTDLITSPVVSWEVWETPPPPSTAALLSFFAQPPAW